MFAAQFQRVGTILDVNGLGADDAALPVDGSWNTSSAIRVAGIGKIRVRVAVGIDQSTGTTLEVLDASAGDAAISDVPLGGGSRNSDGAQGPAFEWTSNNAGDAVEFDLSGTCEFIKLRTQATTGGVLTAADTLVAELYICEGVA
jgi:hypothetical protein